MTRTTLIAGALALLLPRVVPAEEAVGVKGAVAEAPKIVVMNVFDETGSEEIMPGVSRKTATGARLGVALFRVRSTQDRKPVGSPPHRHGEEVAVVLKAGAGKFIAGGREHAVRDGDVLLIPAGVEHGGTFEGGEMLILSIETPPRHSAPAEKGYLNPKSGAKQ